MSFIFQLPPIKWNGYTLKIAHQQFQPSWLICIVKINSLRIISHQFITDANLLLLFLLSRFLSLSFLFILSMKYRSLIVMSFTWSKSTYFTNSEANKTIDDLNMFRSTKLTRSIQQSDKLHLSHTHTLSLSPNKKNLKLTSELVFQSLKNSMLVCSQNFRALVQFFMNKQSWWIIHTCQIMVLVRKLNRET